MLEAAWKPNEDATEVWDLIPPERKSLAKLKRVALRNKAWFSELSWKERRFIDAVIMVVERIRSLLILRLLAPIIKKLLEATRSTRDLMVAVIGEVAYWMREKGRSLAQQLSRIALTWGNKSAAKWPEEKGFVQYLAIINLPSNKPP